MWQKQHAPDGADGSSSWNTRRRPLILAMPAAATWLRCAPWHPRRRITNSHGEALREIQQNRNELRLEIERAFRVVRGLRQRTDVINVMVEICRSALCCRPQAYHPVRLCPDRGSKASAIVRQ